MWRWILIPLGTVLVSWGGSGITSAGMTWYRSISLPSWTPPGAVIGLVWTAIFIATALAGIIMLGKTTEGPRAMWFIVLLVLNGLLNIGWSWLFFGQHLIGWAVLEAALLGISVIGLIILAWPVARTASYLLMPYAAWVAFATYLTATIWNLNR